MRAKVKVEDIFCPDSHVYYLLVRFRLEDGTEGLLDVDVTRDELDAGKTRELIADAIKKQAENFQLLEKALGSREFELEL